MSPYKVGYKCKLKSPKSMQTKPLKFVKFKTTEQQFDIVLTQEQHRTEETINTCVTGNTLFQSKVSVNVFKVEI